MLAPCPEETADRAARHLRMLQELRELGRQLARAAAPTARAEAPRQEPPADHTREEKSRRLLG
jgi:hypothetical protein